MSASLVGSEMCIRDSPRGSRGDNPVEPEAPSVTQGLHPPAEAVGGAGLLQGLQGLHRLQGPQHFVAWASA
eukprot:9703478-Alexandrium_andersonii.AAC.1